MESGLLIHLLKYSWSYHRAPYIDILSLKECTTHLSRDHISDNWVQLWHGGCSGRE